jgi:hypothetical protein
MCDVYISKMKYFPPFENVLSYLYVHHTCFRCKKQTPKKMIFAQFPLSNYGMGSL